MKNSNSNTGYYVITGNIGAGKTTVGRILMKHGATIIEADELARAATAKGTPGLKKIVKVFGKEVLRKSGALNRRALAKVVFNNNQLLNRLNAIVHPIVQRLLNREIIIATKRGGTVFYIVPLWFEKIAADKKRASSVKAVITVAAPKKALITRVQKRSRLSHGEIVRRLAAQLDQSIKIAKSDYVIWNNRNYQKLEADVVKLWHKLSH